MNKKCNIARDLMPLVIDNAASKESGEFVFDHIAACAECRAHFEEMGKELESPQVSQTDTAFAQSVQKLKKRQKRTKILLSVLCVCLAFCLAFGGVEIYNGLLIYNWVGIQGNKADFRIFALPSGEVQIFLEAKDDGSIFYLPCTMQWPSLNTGNGCSVDIWIEEPRIAFLAEEERLEKSVLYTGENDKKMQLIDGQLYMIATEYRVYSAESEILADGSTEINYELRWDAPVQIDSIVYNDPTVDSDERSIYAAGDKIEEIGSEEYATLLTSINGDEHPLPQDFYADETFTAALARAWVRGEELPDMPRDYLPSFNIYTKPGGVTENAKLCAKLFGIDADMIEHPIGIADNANMYSAMMEPPPQDEATPFSTSNDEPLPTATKEPE